MSKRFEYQICYSAFDRVYKINDVWQGPSDIPEAERQEKDILACVSVSEYLQKAGSSGWELVVVKENTIPIGGGKQNVVLTLYLKRELA